MGVHGGCLRLVPIFGQEAANKKNTPNLKTGSKRKSGGKQKQGRPDKGWLFKYGPPTKGVNPPHLSRQLKHWASHS
jgi:hypothetical protein